MAYSMARWALAVKKAAWGRVFFCLDGTVWSTDKDGIIMDLLAAEMTAHRERPPGEHFLARSPRSLARLHYTRAGRTGDAGAEGGAEETLPGPGEGKRHWRGRNYAPLTNALGNGRAPIGGLKVVAANGWFAARPSGTENVYKILCRKHEERSEHLRQIMDEARKIVTAAPG